MRCFVPQILLTFFLQESSFAKLRSLLAVLPQDEETVLTAQFSRAQVVAAHL